MKLKKEDTAKLVQLLEICKLINAEYLAIKPAGASTVTTNSLMICPKNLPNFGGSEVCFSDIGQLRDKLAIFDGEVDIETKENDKNEVVSVVISRGKTQAPLRCAPVRLFKTTSRVNGSDIAIVKMDADDIKIIRSAVKPFSNEFLTIVLKPDLEVKINMTDASGELFTHHLKQEAGCGPGALIETTQVFKYDKVMLTNLIKALSTDEGCTFLLMDTGMIRFPNIMGIGADIYVIPQI